MKTIGIIGANGQVGTEVCLFLSLRPDVRVIPISRTATGSSVLRTCGFECRHGFVASPDQAKELLAGCDLVADFTVPMGTSPEIRDAMRANVGNAIRHSTGAKRYIYISTHGVFRLSTKHPRYRLYSKAKLFAESLAQRTAQETGKEAYVLRLGDVHGVLQGASREYAANLRDEEAVLPDVPSSTVFVFSIAEAVYQIASGNEAPGVYTLVSTPQWSWPEFHSHFCRENGMEPRYRLEPFREPSVADSFRQAARQVAGALFRGVKSEREVLDHLLSTYWPAKARSLRAGYYVKRAAAELAEREKYFWRPATQEFQSKGHRLKSLSDSRLTMAEPTRRVRELLEQSVTKRLSVTL